MKKFFLCLLVCWVSITLVNAQNDEITYSKENNAFSLTVKNDSENLWVNVKGDVTLGYDDKSILLLSHGGFISYYKKNQSLNVEISRGGNLSYIINGNKKGSLSEENKALVADCVKLLIDYGVDAGRRVKRIFAQKGTVGVLYEVSRFKSDYVRERYFSFLLKGQNLSNDEMIALLNKINQYLKSDYYKAQLLDDVRASCLSDQSASDAYLKIIINMTSDYYQNKTVKKLLNIPLNEKQFNQILAVINDMKSDYYQTAVLQVLLRANQVSDNRFSKIMKIAGAIKSDYYKSQIISSLLKNKSITKDRYLLTIASMQNMQNGYYQYTILSGLIDEDVKDESAWSSLIQYTEKIESDYYQAEILMKIADKMPASETLKKELTNAAKKINSDYYYGKIIREVEKKV